MKKQFLIAGLCSIFLITNAFAQSDSTSIGPNTGGLSQPGVSAQPTYGSNVYMGNIQGQINVLASYINNLQAQINNIHLIPGPQGPAGPQGPQGPAGSSANAGAHGGVVNITGGPCGGFIVIYGDGTKSTVMTSAGCSWN